MRTCGWCLELSVFFLVSFVFYLVSLFLFQPFLMSTSASNERSMSNPLCDSSLGSVVTSDYVTPLTHSSSSWNLSGCNTRQICLHGTFLFHSREITGFSKKLEFDMFSTAACITVGRIGWEQDHERNTSGTRLLCVSRKFQQRRIAQMVFGASPPLEYNNIAYVQDWYSADSGSHTPPQNDGISVDLVLRQDL